MQLFYLSELIQIKQYLKMIVFQLKKIAYFFKLFENKYNNIF